MSRLSRRPMSFPSLPGRSPSPGRIHLRSAAPSGVPDFKSRAATIERRIADLRRRFARLDRLVPRAQQRFGGANAPDQLGHFRRIGGELMVAEIGLVFVEREMLFDDLAPRRRRPGPPPRFPACDPNIRPCTPNARSEILDRPQVRLLGRRGITAHAVQQGDCPKCRARPTDRAGIGRRRRSAKRR